MTPPTLRLAEPSSEPRPVDGSERMILLDALRGFALCGVFVSNVFLWFSGRIFLPRAQIMDSILHGSFLNSVAFYVFAVLVSGKFITLFSFMFGLGFSIQLGRAEARGASIVPLYARRLAVLFAIGVTHLFLIWYGDILSTYALLGFALLLFRNRSSRTLVWWAAGLTLLGPILGMLWSQLPQLLASHEAAAAMAKAAGERSQAIRDATLAAFSHGGYLSVVRANFSFYVGVMFTQVVSGVLPLPGLFLLGLLAGRGQLFQQASERRPLFRRLLAGGLVVGGLTSIVAVVVQELMLRKVIHPEGLPWLPFVMVPLRHLADVGLAAVYMSGFALVFQRPLGQRLLSVLAPVGRMALSNYLSQSVISVLVYYGLGLGLINKLGPAASMGLTVAIFGVQIAWSHLWLARFRFGPAEWLWRSLTYGKAQPMRLAAAPSAEPEAAA